MAQGGAVGPDHVPTGSAIFSLPLFLLDLLKPLLRSVRTPPWLLLACCLPALCHRCAFAAAWSSPPTRK